MAVTHLSPILSENAMTFIRNMTLIYLQLEGGTHIFPLWKRLTFKRLILTKSGFKNLNVFLKDLSIDTYPSRICSWCTKE
uniref:SFRICE_031879 n=1 Tax=Spodoptera frugiperda TaxID=7108 RepID=A0A2H1WVT0_SPOFR